MSPDPTDAGGGTPRNIGILEAFGFSYFLKGYSYQVALPVCQQVDDWQKILNKDGGYFGISKKRDLPNLKEFCDVVPELEVFGFRQETEDDTPKYAHFLTNVEDYIRLSTDGSLTGVWRYYHKRASIESSIKTERNILNTAHKRGRGFIASWGYLIVAAIAYNLLYLLRDLFFSGTNQQDIGMKDFVRDAINIKCQVVTKKVRGQPLRNVFLVLDTTNKYAKAFFKKLKTKAESQLLLPFSRESDFQQSLLALRL